jgi:uncharacterized protein
MTNYREIETTNGIIRGYEHKPDLSKGKIFIQHGYFSSSHMGPNRLYWQIAELLCKMNFTVYRFACYGMGDSDGQFTDTTYQLHIDNNIEIIESYSKKEDKLIFIGHSMGTSIAVRLATIFQPDKLILISPSIGRIDTIENLFSLNQRLELERIGKTERKGLLVCKKFMENSQDEIIFDYCKNVVSKVDIHYGLVDELYNHDSAKSISRRLRGNLNLYEDADHNFLNIKSREKMLKKVISFVVNEESV